MLQALDGLTVVDFSHVVAGPLATHFLALNGARVIKIEPPQGDPLRNYTINKEQMGKSPAFEGINLGKESVVLDLKSDEGLAAAHKLVESADIIVENFRPGVMTRLGLGYETLKSINPKLIYCAISGFGQNGALKDVPAIDQIVQSVSGLMNLSGKKGDPAQRIGFPIVDTFTGLLAAFAIQTAIVQRERGLVESQFIDVAMLDATLVMLLSVVNPLLLAGEEPVRTGNLGFSRAPTADTFETAEGQLTIGAVEQKQVEKLLHVLGLSELLTLPKYADRAARLKNSEAMREKLQSSFMIHSAHHWEVLLQKSGVPAARVADLKEAISMPHLADRNLFLTTNSGARVLNAGFKFSQGGPGQRAPAPELGGQTAAVLNEIELRQLSQRQTA